MVGFALAGLTWSWANGQEPDGAAVALALESQVTSAIERAERSVVAILAFRKDRADLLIGDRDPRQRLPDRYGAGVVFDDSGRIVTCAHVLGTVEDHEYEVWFAGRQVPVRAIVSAASGWMDLAVLTVEPTGLTPMPAADGVAPRKGQFVIALGNPHGIARDGEVSASWGMISNVTRPAPTAPRGPTESPESVHALGTLIQTQIAADVGASGGALINLKGEWIGLVTRLPGLGGDGATVGFAIPVDEDFRAIVTQLATGRLPKFGFLGVMPEDASRLEMPSGASLRFVQPGSPAAAADLLEGDVVTSIDGQPISGRTALLREVGKKPAGKTIAVTLVRGPNRFGRVQTLQRAVTLSGRTMEAAGDYASVTDPP